MSESIKRMTFEDLVAIEPRLGPLYEEVKEARVEEDVFAYFDRYFRERMTRLVGFHAESNDPRIQTPQAYDVALYTLTTTLEDNNPDW